MSYGKNIMFPGQGSPVYILVLSVSSLVRHTKNAEICILMEFYSYYYSTDWLQMIEKQQIYVVIARDLVRMYKPQPLCYFVAATFRGNVILSHNLFLDRTFILSYFSLIKWKRWLCTTGIFIAVLSQPLYSCMSSVPKTLEEQLHCIAHYKASGLPTMFSPLVEALNSRYKMLCL